MGTVVSVRPGTSSVGAEPDAAASASHDDRAAVDMVVEVFDRWERRFSLFDPRSELSRVASGELLLPEASAELRDAYALALAWRDRTEEASRRIDPTASSTSTAS